MSIPENMKIIIGQWKGKNSLWMDPKEPAFESEAAAKIIETQNGQFIELNYSWFFENEKQVGRYIICRDGESQGLRSIWFDSWHMADSFMLCTGKASENGKLILNAHYPAPQGPDWGWDTEIDIKNKNELIILMYNISPEGAKNLAVEIMLTRI